MKNERVKELKKYLDIILFAVTLMVANYLWKWTVTGDEDGERVTWLCWNVTAAFEYLSCHVASAVYRLVSLFRDTVHMTNAHTIRFDSGSGTSVIWSCSGLKQAFIWLCLILTVRGNAATWWHKLWFIPFGWLCCHAFNILRIVLIALLIEHHPEWFFFLHDMLFKYLFYGLMFGLWVLFVEKIRPTTSTH